MVMNLLQSLNSWLQDQSGDEISYEALEKIVDNTAQVSPERVCLTFRVKHIVITHKRATGRGAERSKAACPSGHSVSPKLPQGHGSWVKLDITYLIIPKGLIKINIDTFKTAVYEALGVCCCFGARPTCLQCTTLSNWNSHLDASLAFSAQINGSMNRWEGINRLCPWRDGLVRAHTHTHTRPKIFTIDMWVTLSIRPATAEGWGERNDFVSEKICYWI